MKRLCLLLALVLGFAVRLFLIFSIDQNTLINCFFFDDSFYLLNIARNIAAGNGITHDGLHVTNGFQPLYVLVLVPIYWIADLNRIFPIYFAAVFLSICSVVSAFLCFKIIERLFNTKAAFFSLLFTLFSPVALNFSLNGAETSLAIMLFLAVVHVYLKDFQFVRLTEIPTGKLVLFGSLSGLAIYARVDMLILVFALYAEIIYFHLRDAGNIGANLKRFLALSFIVVAIISPWFTCNLAYFGSLIPLSGKAVRQITTGGTGSSGGGLMKRGFSGEQKGEPTDQSASIKAKLYSDKDFLFFRISVAETHRVLKKYAVFPDWIGFYWKRASRYLESGPFLGRYLQLPSKPPTLPLFALSGLLAFIWYRRERETCDTKQLLNNLKKTRVLIFFSVVLITAYIWKVPGFWFFKRYFAPVFYVIVIFLSLLLSILFDLLRSKNKWYRYSFVTVLVSSLLVFWYILINLGLDAWKRRTTNLTYPGVISYIQDNFQKTDTFGALQSGYFSYFLDQKVHNLDGVVNPKVLAAIELGQLDSYILSENIDYLVDRYLEINRLFNKYPKLKSKSSVVWYPADSMFVIYKVHHSR